MPGYSGRTSKRFPLGQSFVSRRGFEFSSIVSARASQVAPEGSRACRLEDSNICFQRRRLAGNKEKQRVSSRGFRFLDGTSDQACVSSTGFKLLGGARDAPCV